MVAAGEGHPVRVAVVAMTGVAVEAAAVAMKAAEVATVEAETVGELTETLDATRFFLHLGRGSGCSCARSLL